MKITELPNAPEWLKNADTCGANVEWSDSGRLIWLGGKFRGGEFCGGAWHGGEWYGGEFRNGEWHDRRINRLNYHAILAGLVRTRRGWRGWRSTNADGTGRYTQTFVQQSGEYYEDDALPRGSGTCCKGIHVAGQATAFTYFGIDPTAQLWQVDFSEENLLDCDGQKARIRGGVFTKVKWDFLNEGG